MSVSIVISGVVSAKWQDKEASDQRPMRVLEVETEDGRMQEVVLWSAAKKVKERQAEAA